MVQPDIISQPFIDKLQKRLSESIRKPVSLEVGVIEEPVMRRALFRDTSGGAYFFLSKDNEVIIPGPDYQIFYIHIKDRKFDRTRMVSYEILEEIEKGEFDDNINFLMKAMALGNKNYHLKVFNNIWATYTFGPNNSIYIGAYRGFLKFSSDPKPSF